jgi:hypothetical protein
MAKGKQAAALFEVIHGNKHFDRATTRGILRTPKWWFKRRNGATAFDAAPVESATRVPVEPAGPPAGPFSSSPGGIRISVDPDGQHVTLRLSYTATAVVLFTYGVLMVLAFMAGRQWRQAPSATLLSSVTTEQLQAMPAQPAVLDVARSSEEHDDSADVEEPAGDDGSLAGGAAAASPQAAPQWNDPRRPATLVVDGPKRDIGLNYVIVQSYADEKLAGEAVNILKENGVDCTIERGIKGWPSNLYIVVGTRGFDKISSPEYGAYEKKIHAVSKKFAPKGGWKAFTPIAKKWDRPS